MPITVSGIERDLKENRRVTVVRERLFSLRSLAKGRSKRSLALELGVCERTLSRWEKCYLAGGARALQVKSKSGRPKARWLRGKVAARVLQLRERYGWGAEVLQAHVFKLFGIRATLYQINQLLARKRLHKRVRRKKKNKHTRRVKIFTPGQHTQMDVRHVDDKDAGEKRYVYNFVDHASKWTFKHVYDSYGPMETRDFVLQLLSHCPFAIARLQTDNGIEFTNRFLGGKEHVLERICKENGIRLKFIPPGEKELQGLVEGHHRIDKDEFFTRIGKRSVDDTNHLLKDHLVFRNNVRGFKTNSWMSPNEYLWAYVKIIFAMALFYAQKSKRNVDQNPEQILNAA